MSSSRPRKRDMVRGLFRGSSQPFSQPTTISQANIPLQASATSNLTASASQTSLSTPPGEKFFNEALLALKTEEQETIHKFWAPGTRDITIAVEGAYNAALNHKQICEDNRLKWSFQGREVVLRDEADKIVRWLDRFKSIGDVVVNVNPLHLGLPWAGIRVILEMTVSESRQRSALLTGMNLVLFIINRLKVYFDYFMRLPSMPAKEKFENELIAMYAHVLRFMAKALQAYQNSTLTRTLQALWETSTLEAFETECDRLGSSTEIAASNCDRELRSQQREETNQWKKDLDKTLEKLDEIRGLQTSLDILQVEVDLAQLMTAAGATYNSYAEGDFTKCLEGTRTDLIQRVVEWANDPSGKCIFWLCGMAGTGKSTLSRTVAHILDKDTAQNRLGASFFFKRGELDRGNASRFFPTIAIQLANIIPGLKYFIAKALGADSLLCERNLQVQSEKLLVQPLLSAVQATTPRLGIIIVIDALDECEHNADIKMILRALTRVEAITSVRLRVFVTSRPKLPIQLEFKHLDGRLHNEILLEEVQAATIEHDIRIYFNHRFKEIISEDQLSQTYDPLPTDWPGNDSIEALIGLSVPLFIFASTVCRYISESNPRKRLDIILRQRGISFASDIEKMYVPILNELVLHRDSQEHDRAITEFRELVGSIVLLTDPLSASSLSSLLEIHIGDVRERLKHLHSVLNIPKEHNHPIRLLHLSFRDFLVNPKGKDRHQFHIDEAQTHGKLAAQCLRLLNRPKTLEQDLLGIKKPGMRRAEISKQQIVESIPADVAYACCNWVCHLSKGGVHIYDNGPVHQFLQSHFLYWLEALSWLDRLAGAVSFIINLKSLIIVDQGAQLLAFLDDAERFVLKHRYVIDLAPLQVYLSALVFTPTQSVVRRKFNKYAEQWLSLFPTVPSNWSAEIQILRGDESPVTAVAFSPDGQVVASASKVPVRLWKEETGEEMHKLEGHNKNVTAVTFSPDYHTVASASEDRTVQFWDAWTGEEIQKFEACEILTAMAFSPDGQVLACGSDDSTIQLWNVREGEILKQLEGHYGGVEAIAFPRANRVVALGRSGWTTWLETAKRNEESHEFGERVTWILPVALSPDANIVASGSNVRSLQLWNTMTGRKMQELEIDVSGATIAFSSDGNVVASGQLDGTVYLWDPQTGSKTRTFAGHSRWVTAIAFSPFGHVVASGTADGILRLWSTNTIGEIQDPEKSDDTSIKAVAISSDGRAVASMWNGKIGTLELWNVSTGKVVEAARGTQMILEEGYVTAMAFSADGQFVALGTSEGGLELWNVGAGEVMMVYRRPEDFKVGFSRIEEVAFSADGQAITSRSSVEVVIWNTATRELRIEPIDGRLELYPDEVEITNTESFDLRIRRPVIASEATPPATVEVRNHWIHFQGHDMLLLPDEFRGGLFASNCNQLVIGLEDGTLLLFEFKQDCLSEEWI